MAISEKARYHRYCNEVKNMTNKYIEINKTLPTTHYKYDKQTKLWHCYISDCNNNILQDFGYNEKFENCVCASRDFSRG